MHLLNWFWYCQQIGYHMQRGWHMQICVCNCHKCNNKTHREPVQLLLANFCILLAVAVAYHLS